MTSTYSNLWTGHAASDDAPHYSNTVNVNASQWDITLDFRQSSQISQVLSDQANQPQLQQQPVASVVMSPMHAKALSALLASTIEGWERRFGQLPPLDALMPGFEQQLAEGIKRLSAEGDAGGTVGAVTIGRSGQGEGSGDAADPASEPTASPEGSGEND